MSEVAARPADALRDALLESRQRWRDLVTISADMAFETDDEGRFVFLSPADVIGWVSDDLIGRPSATLLPDGETGGFNPFRTELPLRNRRVWVKCGDGTLSWMSISAAPFHDASGRLTGVRGVARDVTELDRAEVAMARAVRRSELIDHVMWHMRTEVMAPRMMTKALQALVTALGAHGAMVVQAPAGEGGAASESLLYQVGGQAPGLQELALRHLAAGNAGPLLLRTPEGHGGMLCATPTRFDSRPGVLVWRLPKSRPWDGDELSLLASAVGALRMVLEQGAVQREMARQSRTDWLTGLCNRAGFDEDMERRIERLERQSLPGSLLYVDIDGMKRFNAERGQEAGDQLLRTLAAMLRTATRPGDLISRLGGDHFAVWLDGMDELAAAERADRLCRTARVALDRLYGGDKAPTVSIAVVGRWPGCASDGPQILRRAGSVMALVKAAGGGQWRVWHGEDGDDV